MEKLDPGVNTQKNDEKNYTIQVEKTKDTGTEFHNFFFRNGGGALLGYVKAYVNDTNDCDVHINIIDTISSYKIEKNLEKYPGYIRIFKQNGYDNKVSRKDFGSTMLSEVLKYFQLSYKGRKIYVKIISHDESREFIIKLIEKVESRTHDIIENSNGGNQNYTASLNLFVIS